MSDYKAELNKILDNLYGNAQAAYAMELSPNDDYYEQELLALLQSETTKARLAGAIDELQKALYYTDDVWVKRDKVDSHEQIIHANRIKDRIAQLQAEGAKL